MFNRVGQELVQRQVKPEDLGRVESLGLRKPLDECGDSGQRGIERGLDDHPPPARGQSGIALPGNVGVDRDGSAVESQGHAGDVIELLGFAAEFGELTENLIHDPLGVFAGQSGELLLQPFTAVLLTGLVLRLGDAVGVEEQGRLGVERNRGLGVLQIGQDAQRDAAGMGDHLRPAVRGDDVGRIVTGVDVGQGSELQVDHAEERGDEQFLGIH